MRRNARLKPALDDHLHPNWDEPAGELARGPSEEGRGMRDTGRVPGEWPRGLIGFLTFVGACILFGAGLLGAYWLALYPYSWVFHKFLESEHSGRLVLIAAACVMAWTLVVGACAIAGRRRRALHKVVDRCSTSDSVRVNRA